eukprot:218450_1
MEAAKIEEASIEEVIEEEPIEEAILLHQMIQIQLLILQLILLQTLLMIQLQILQLIKQLKHQVKVEVDMVIDLNDYLFCLGALYDEIIDENDELIGAVTESTNLLYISL